MVGKGHVCIAPFAVHGSVLSAFAKESSMFKAIFGIGAIGVIGIYYMSKYAREKLKHGQNPLAF